MHGIIKLCGICSGSEMVAGFNRRMLIFYPTQKIIPVDFLKAFLSFEVWGLVGT
jgi:hypothetical protein